MATDRHSINAVLAQNLAAFMREQELTQMSLATRAQMGQSTVSLSGESVRCTTAAHPIRAELQF